MDSLAKAGTGCCHGANTMTPPKKTRSSLDCVTQHPPAISIPATTPFMVNYIVKDLDALLDRLNKTEKIDAKRTNESHGHFDLYL